MTHLFEKSRIKGMELKNRLVRSATHEGMSDKNGFPEKALFRLYERLAKGGVGLIITGHAFVAPDGNSLFKGMQGIDSEEHIPAYRELVEQVHGNGAKIVKIIKNKVDIAVFLVGGLTNPVTMEEIIERGDADFISLCRALIADPQFPEKIRNGGQEPSRCIHCNLCVGYLTRRPVHCYHGKMIKKKGSRGS